MFLLDTDVVSETGKRPHGGVMAWMASIPDAELNISSVTFGELQAGAELTRGRDPGKAAEIEAWIDRMAATHNILPMDVLAYRLWARLLRGKSRDLGGDAMIAATAMVHNLTVVTRNVRDFVPFGVPTLNPFDYRGGCP